MTDIELPVTNFAGDVDSDGTLIEGCNLEGEPVSGLAEFVALCDDRIRLGQIAGQLFPTRGEEARVRATVLYAAFAAVRCGAMIQRANGRINSAFNLESECCSLYGEMPEWARW